MSRQKAHKYSEEEEQMVRDLYPVVGGKELGELTGLGERSILSKANKLGVLRHAPCKRWSKEEDDYLREQKGRMTYEQIGRVLGRTKRSVHWRNEVLGLQPKRVRKVPDEEVERVRSLLHLGYREIIERSGLSKNRIEVIMNYRLGCRGAARSKPWRIEEIEYLLEHYDKKPVSELVKGLPGRSLSGICQITHKIGIRLLKDDSWTDKDTKKLLRYIGQMRPCEIAKKMGVKPDRIYGRIRTLKKKGLI